MQQLRGGRMTPHRPQGTLRRPKVNRWRNSLIPDFANAGNSGPVKPMTLPERCHDDAAPAIAVIDVDGILLNTDFSGLSSPGENPVSLFRERLDAAACDSCVQAIVVRINSP